MTPHQLVKGTSHSIPFKLHLGHHPEGQSTYIKCNSHLFFPLVAISEVNDSRPVGSRHYALIDPSNYARGFRLGLIAYVH